MTQRLFSTLLCLFLLPAGLAFSGDKKSATDDGGSIHPGTVAPVLLHTEPPDSGIVTLPGPPPEPVFLRPENAPVAVPSVLAAPVAPLEPAAPSPIARLVGPAALPVIPAKSKPSEEARPFLRRGKRDFPAGFEENPPKFLQQQIGQWKEFDVLDILGKPLRQRPAFGDDQRENGTIYAFADPTGHNKEFELDFAAGANTLRTVFVYPVKLTWQSCRQTFGANVSAATAPQGRKFYSYLDRRMDVLVDASGEVISLGFY